MRERVYEVDKQILGRLSKKYRPSYIIDELGISKQVWWNYRTGKHDLPESIVDRICDKFQIEKSELALR